MRENALQYKIKKALKRLGAKVIIIHGGRFMARGEPDTIGCYEGHAFALEIKAGTGHPLSDIQIHRLREWHKSGARVGVPYNVADAVRIVTGVAGPLYGIPSDAPR